jgi:hypothetical protein
VSELQKQNQKQEPLTAEAREGFAKFRKEKRNRNLGIFTNGGWILT